MCKSRSGPPAAVIKCSKGAEDSKLHFYSTSYSSNYGKEGFLPKAAKPKGTGYLANFRPNVSYTSTIDKLDNLAVGELLKDNYDTSYCKQHRPYYTGSSGNDKLPLKMVRNESGFTQKTPITTADTKAVQEARLMTMDEGRHRPLLRRLQNKRVAHLDQGSPNLVTETNVCYKGEPSRRMNTHLKLLRYDRLTEVARNKLFVASQDLGTMEPSGFTHYHHFDPIQYLHRAPYGGETYCRPTERSEHQGNFVRWPTLSGSEMNRGVCGRAQRDNGYSYETARPRFVKRIPQKAFTTVAQVPPPVTKRIMKNDPCEMVNMQRGADHSTLAKAWFRGDQHPHVSASDLRSVGNKESTGFSANNDRYVKKKDNKSQFTTHYDVNYGQSLRQVKYAGKAACIDPSKPTNGFTKSTLVHSYGDGRKFEERGFESHHPLVAKVIKVENPCYLDNTKNPKRRDPPLAI